MAHFLESDFSIHFLYLPSSGCNLLLFTLVRWKGQEGDLERWNALAEVIILVKYFGAAIESA
jgi:hypothetical protein